MKDNCIGLLQRDIMEYPLPETLEDIKTVLVTDWSIVAKLDPSGQSRACVSSSMSCHIPHTTPRQSNAQSFHFYLSELKVG